VIAYLVLSPQLETSFQGNERMLSWTVAGLAAWLGWVVTLLIAEWWLERGGQPSPAGGAAASLVSALP
jgi:hypothetical protein